MKEPIIKIGLTYTGTDEKHNNYIRWLMGNEAIEITTLSSTDTSLESINNFDGIVLSGGVDMHPKFYNSTITNYPNQPDQFQEERDEFEIAVFKKTQQHHIPLLAVCRGMQLVNCVLGGNLTQDIGQEANRIHKFEQQDKAHGINIVPATLLNEITGVDRTITNSAHHQCINILGEGLLINCKSDDGIAEGIEWADKVNKSFFLGVQWHPERMYKFHLSELPSAKNIRDRFIKEIKTSIEKDTAG
jgi:putative glutamine amidotransferase